MVTIRIFTQDGRCVGRYEDCKINFRDPTVAVIIFEGHRVDVRNDKKVLEAREEIQTNLPYFIEYPAKEDTSVTRN